MQRPDIAVLISLRPKWCHLIVTGKKTIEVRKTSPRISPPFTCLLYCTKSKHRPGATGQMDPDVFYRTQEGKLVFGNDAIITEEQRMNGKIIGECTVAEIIDIDCDSVAPFNHNTGEYIEQQTCLSREELWHYTHGIRAKGWCLTDVKLYQHPYRPKSVPQSWCYNQTKEDT